MIRPDQRLDAGRLAAVQRGLVGLDALAADLRIGAHRVVVDAADGHAGSGQAGVVEVLAPLGILLHVDLEHRQLDGVEADLLDLVQQGQRLVGQRIGPQQQVHSVTHDLFPVK